MATGGLQNNPILNRLPGNASLGDQLRSLMDDHGMRTDKLIPAKVVTFDRAQNIATIQPMIMLVDTNGNSRLRNQIASIPVLSLGGGGYHISFPLKAGDLGWILAADRDISLFLSTLAAAQPNTNRKHKFNDAWFVPDVFRQYTIAGEDDAAMVLQATDSSTRIAIGEGTVNITAPTSVKVTTPKATFTQDVHVEGSLIFDGNLTVTGMLAANGGFNATGGGNLPCTLPTDTTIGGIAVYGHGHIQTAVAGQRTSGGMTA